MMEHDKQPVYMIGVAAQLCGIHPQTLRQYERLGLVKPARVGSKNRLYSEADILRVRCIQRLTQQLGVNLAGAEVILKLLDDMDEMREDLESQMEEYRLEAEKRIRQLMSTSSTPIRKNDSLLPAVHLRWRKIEF